MNLFTKVLSIFRKKPIEEQVLPLVNKSEVSPYNWRTGMWIVYDGKIGILKTVGIMCEVSYTDSVTGQDIGNATIPLNGIRQAKYLEIPQDRRQITAQNALELGYGS